MFMSMSDGKWSMGLAVVGGIFLGVSTLTL
jgi:hypothetical protein